MARSNRLTFVLLFGLSSLGGGRVVSQETAHEIDRFNRMSRSDIRDIAGLFGADSIASGRRELQRIEKETGAATIIETVDTLKDEPPDRVARQLATKSGIHGIFVLIARKERKLEILESGVFRRAINPDRRNAIRAAFFEGFRRQDFNEGLKRGVSAIGEALSAALRDGELPRPPSPASVESAHPSTAGPTSTASHPQSSTPAALATLVAGGAEGTLVLRNQVRMTLAGARAILAGAEAKARAMDWKMNIAVVDDGGHLLAFERMDGARPASGYTALTKATTAATFRQPTGPLPAGTSNPDPLLNLSLQNAATASGGKITTLFGGVPVVVDGQVIGGVGVGGGSGEQDAQVARAGIQALLDQLNATQAGAKGTWPPEGVKPKAAEPGSSAKKDDSDF